MTKTSKRVAVVLWVLGIALLAVLHGVHLRADFPNHTQWMSDLAKYTDEGWYANAAMRAHLQGSWYRAGDFNPAPAVPVWPLLEWALFFFTGVTMEAARGLGVAFFLLSLPLSYLLLKDRGPRWMALLGATMIAASPFLYSFSRLAVLEPMLIALLVAALNLAVRLPGMRRPMMASFAIGLLCSLMLLTKTTAVFLLPALGWAMATTLRRQRKLALRCGATVALTAVLSLGLWMALIVHAGLLPDFLYLFGVNTYEKPAGILWPLFTLPFVLARMVWIDSLLIPLTGVLAAALYAARRATWVRELLLDPVFGASLLAVAGYVVFMVYQCHIQPRYFSVMAYFCFFVLLMGTRALLGQSGRLRRLGVGILVAACVAVAVDGLQTVRFLSHPEYTFVHAAEEVTGYMDAHPNGNRLLLAEDSDQITLATHLPTISEQFATPSGRFPDLLSRMDFYQPGWYLTLGVLRGNILEKLHTRYAVEQVGSWKAFDRPEGDAMVLFKLHPLAMGQRRDPARQNLRVPLPGDRIEIPIQ